MIKISPRTAPWGTPGVGGMTEASRTRSCKRLHYTDTDTERVFQTNL